MEKKSRKKLDKMKLNAENKLKLNFDQAQTPRNALLNALEGEIGRDKVRIYCDHKKENKYHIRYAHL